MDSEAACQHLFTRTPSELFHSPLLAFEFIRFCRDNLPLFGRNLGVLKSSFPNLFKARSPDPGPESGAGVPGQGCTGSLGPPLHHGASGHVPTVTTGLGAGGRNAGPRARCGTSMVSVRLR